MTIGSDRRNGVRVTGAGRGRGTAVWVPALAAAVWACGGLSSTDAPPQATVVTIQTFRGDSTPIAFQDGDGPWKKLAKTNGTSFALVTAGRYAIAVTCVWGGGSWVNLYYLSITDTTQLHTSSCFDARPMVNVSAQLEGIPDDQQGEVYFGGSLAVQQTTGGPFKTTIIRGEPVDVLISALDDSNVPRQVFRGPEVDAREDQALQYDLTARGAPPESQPLTVTGLEPRERVEVRSFLSTRPSQPAWFVDYLPSSTTPPDYYSSVPVAAGRRPDDITMVYLLARPMQLADDCRSYARSATVAMKTPAPITMALPAPWNIESPTLENSALRRASLTLPATSGDQDPVDYFLQLYWLGPHDSRWWNLTIGAGWLQGSGPITVTTPDPGDLVEGPAAIALPLDQDVSWHLSRRQRNVEFGTVAADGMRLFSNSIQGTTHPPASHHTQGTVHPPAIAVGSNGGWTPWLNRDAPSGEGDYETRVDFGTQVPCSNPVAIQCQTTSGVDYTQAGEIYSCTPSVGGFCVNAKQPDEACLDYRVRFECP